MPQDTHLARAQPGFCGMKKLGVLVPPPPPSRKGNKPITGLPSSRNPFIHMGEERQHGVKILVLSNRRKIVAVSTQLQQLRKESLKKIQA